MPDLAHSKIRTHILETDEAVYWEMACDMFETITLGNERGQKTVMLAPVGPVQHYQWLAFMVNRAGLSLRNTWLINMDEYLTDSGEYIREEESLSFRGFMRRGFHELIDSELRVSEDQRVFPKPGAEAQIGELIEKLGGWTYAMEAWG